jgi:hypothetical protein
VVSRLVELEFAERVDNTLKVIGDFYLARVTSAVRRFRIRAWRRASTPSRLRGASPYPHSSEIDARTTLLGSS